MSRNTTPLDDRLHDYLLENSLREPDILARLRAETAEMPDAGMQISPEQGQFMALLIELMGAERCLEIGTFTGYSALAVARALPPHGRLIACEIDEGYARVARRYWQEAGLGDRIELRLGPGLRTLDALLAEGAAESFDFAFIDADKQNYQGYYERALELLRPGGLIAVDNVLWHGAVADPADDTASTAAIRKFNAAVRDDSRVTLSLVPIGDGLTLARKRP